MKMKELILLIGILSGFASAIELPADTREPTKDCGKIIGCYYFPNLDYDEGGLLFEDIDLDICTHIFYYYAKIDANASVEVGEPRKDIANNGYRDFNNLRKKNPKIKTLAAMQVMYDESTQTANYKPLVDPKLRGKLVNNIVTFVKKYGFSGVDIDFSDPPTRNESPSDKKNIVLLLKALRERFVKESLILSISVSIIEEIVKKLYDIEEISTYVDFINLATDQFYRDGDHQQRKLGHTSPLYHSSNENTKERKMNIDNVVNSWISQHAPASKLILGISMTGASYTLADPKKFGRGAAITDKPGDLSGRSGYSSICSLIKKWTYFYDNEQQVPYIHKENQIIAYDDVRSIRAKAEYVNKKHLGGAMAYNIDDDDYSGGCGEKFPLLKALGEVLRNKC